MMKRLRAAMFDLDGTLADTLADIAACGNAALEALGRSPLPVTRYRYLAGQGARALVRDALGVPEDDPRIEQGLRYFLERQLAHGMDRTKPYPGVPEMLDEMTRRGWRLAVLSNKPHAATVAMIERLFARWRFDAVRGQRDGGPLKPDPAQALEIAGELGIPPDEWMYLGDTRVDMLTARAAGMWAVGALWGFRDAEELKAAGADALLVHPRELWRWVDGEPSS
jgi:phosphoglycolate phosphatase